MQRKSRTNCQLLLVVGALSAALIPGCISEQCDTSGEAPQSFRGGRTNGTRSFYESSTEQGPYLFFPAGRVYRFMHGLSEKPAELHTYLAFEEFPLQSGAGFSQSAGNQVMYENVTDDYVQIRNDTCAEMFVRLWARVAPFEAQDTADAGNTPGASDASAASPSVPAEAAVPSAAADAN